MYSLRLTVMPVMDLHHLSGAVLEHLDDGTVEVVATFSHDILLSDAWLHEGECISLLETVRQWSERTMRQ